MTQRLRRSFNRTVTLDPMEEYDGTIFERFDEFADWLEDHLEDETFHVVCRFTDETHIDALFSAVWLIENCCLIVEEANIFFDPHSKIESFKRLVSQGRHKRISLVCVSQRVPELPISFRAQKNTIVTFQQTEPYDLKKLEEYGFDPEEVAQLESTKGSKTIEEGKHFLTCGDPLTDEEIVPVSVVHGV